MVAGQVAVALLEAEDEAVGLARVGQLGDDVADVLEARQATAQLEAVFRSQRIDHGRRHDGGHGHLARQVLAALGAHAAHVIQQQHAHLVAGQQRVVVTILAGHAHAVGIGVGGQQQVGMHLLAQVDALLHGLADLGVGIGARGEVAVGLLLLGHHGDVGDASAREHRGNGDQARAVERRVHQLQRRGGDLLVGQVVHRLRQHRVVVALEHGVFDPLDLARCHGLIEVHGLHAGERVGSGDGRGDGGGSLAGDLAAVGAVGLVAVVRRGVVAGGHADAARTAQVAHGPRKRGDRGDARVHVCRHAVGGHDGGGGAHEQLTVVAAVAGYGDGGVVEVRVQVIGEALRGAAHRVDVHAVRAGAQNAAQARGAERQVLEEGVGHCGVVAGVGLRLHVGQLSRQIGVLHVLNPMRKLGAHIDIAHKVSFASSGFPRLLGRDRARRGHSPRAAGIRPMRHGHAPALQPGFPVYAAHCKRHAAEAREPDSISAVARRMTRRRRDPR